MLVRMESIRTLTAGGSAKIAQPLWKFVINLDILLSDDPAITVLRVYLRELKTFMCTKTCTYILITTLFIISRT